MSYRVGPCVLAPTMNLYPKVYVIVIVVIIVVFFFSHHTHIKYLYSGPSNTKMETNLISLVEQSYSDWIKILTSPRFIDGFNQPSTPNLKMIDSMMMMFYATIRLNILLIHQNFPFLISHYNIYLTSHLNTNAHVADLIFRKYEWNLGLATTLI